MSSDFFMMNANEFMFHFLTQTFSVISCFHFISIFFDNRLNSE